MKTTFKYKFKIYRPVIICYADFIGPNFYVVSKGKAICSEHDSFNIEKGKELALARAKESALRKAIIQLNNFRKELNKRRWKFDEQLLAINRMFTASNKHKLNIEHNYGLEH